jgi:hypothetical protein
MAVERFTRERIIHFVRVIGIAALLGIVVGTVTSAIIGVGVQYLGPLEGYRLGALVGALIGGVYGGASGLGIRGLIGGVLVGALVGAGIGNAAWNHQLAGAANPDQSYDPIRFPAIGLDRMLVIGAETGAVVGAIAGSIPGGPAMPRVEG